VAVIKVAGEIDLRTARTVRTGLVDVAEAGFRRIVVDFEQVRFCDATGLGALVAAHNRLHADGGELRLARVQAAQRRIFRITGLDRLFTLHESVEDAVGEGRTPTASPLG
jgi:anti-anti-sigma factor